MTADSRAVIIQSEGEEHRFRRSTHLPERLSQRSAIMLAALEGATLLFVSLVALSGTENTLPVAFLVTASICVATWLCGLYSRSYAVLPRDEIYLACACVALTAVPITLILVAIAGVPAVFVVIALLCCALAASVVRVHFHLRRRSRPLVPTLRTISPRGWSDRESQIYRFSKRAFDLIVAALLFVPVSAIMLIVALAVLIDSGRPLLFRQERLGENAVPFTIYKFRTLHVDADSSWVKAGDNRVTNVGARLRKLSFDEFPQIFNVLKGEMSLVGPRPEMTQFARDFNESIPNYTQRYVVTPGITGWAQLYFKRILAPEDASTVLSYDLFYVEHASIVLDTALILKTICEVLINRPQ